MAKITVRDMLIAMILAGDGTWDSEERIKEEMKILKLIEKVDEYLSTKGGVLNVRTRFQKR